MTQHIHESAARYQPDHNGNNPPMPSATQALANPQQLVTEHIDLWTTAVRHKSTAGRGSGNSKNRKIELTGIKKLRELILELAVRGKLVAQNPDDEPASKLLERIEAEKAQLIKDGKLKKQKPLPPMTDEEKPFELPQGWEYERLANLTDIQSGIAKGKKFDRQDTVTFPYLRVANVQRGFLILDEMKEIEILKSDVEKYAVIERDLLITEGGDWDKVGRTAIWPRYDGIMLHQNHVFKARLILADQSEIWMERFLNSRFAREYFAGSSKQTTNLASINKTQLSNTVIPVPPLAEQHRIVAKVDKLMALCDQLEQQSEHQLDAHQQLTETMLSALLTPAAGALTESASATTKSSQKEQLNDNWQRLAQHFDLLFSGPMGAWAIDRLKDTILQLAVMGKLVPQNPADEPASELLKRIDAEKARLVKEGKIKKPKKLPPVSDEEKPFELPEGWEWENLGSLVVNMDSGWSPACPATPAPDERTWGVLKTTAVQRMKYLEEENKQLPSEKEPRPEYEVNAGDILITRAGPKNRVGISCLVKISRPKLMISDKIIRFHLAPPASCGEFITLCLNAGATADYLERSKSGMAESQMNISQGKLLVAPIALPPLAEQQRIVAKVDELFTLCDQLKERLQHASDTQLNLTDAIVEQALS